MTIQLRRCWIFLAGNFAVSGAFIAGLVLRAARDPLWSADDRVWWAKAIMVFIFVQIVFRILAMIALAVQTAASGGTEQVDREDELDKAIGYRTTSFTSGIFMLAFITAVVTQAMGLPLYWLFATMTGGMIVSGFLGDVVNLIHYRRGY